MRPFPSPAHVPVLLKECLKYLAQQPQKPKIYCDATFGNGGYTRALLETFDCTVLAIDQDPHAIERAHDMIDANPQFKNRLVPIHGSFGNLYNLVTEHFQSKEPMLDGILFDIGLSSNQLNDPARGFSFRNDGPLDMRMQSTGNLASVPGQRTITAEAIVNGFPISELADIIFKYGEERQAKKIAASIERARLKEPITSTTQLAQIVASSLGMPNKWYYSKSHPATKTFQALRIYINDELNQLHNGLVASEYLLKPDGLLLVVNFHSLEDRLCKRFANACQKRERKAASIDEQIKANPAIYRKMRREAYIQDMKYEKEANSDEEFYTNLERIDEPEFPVDESPDKQGSFESLTKRVVKPTEEEIEENPRARSAKLRILKRTIFPPVHPLLSE